MPDVVEKRTELFFQEGNSDKVYRAELVVHDDGSCSVKVQWGRRGGGLNTGNKAVRVDRAAAQKTFDRLLREKTNKGYQEITDGVAPAAVAPPEGEGSGSKTGNKQRPKVGPRAQLLNPIDDDECAALLDDDDWVAQQKLDGIRILCTVQGDRVLPTNRDGQESDNVPAALLAGLEALPEGSIVDGEVVGDGYWLFDVLRVGDRDVTGAGVVARWHILDDELSPGLSGAVQVLPVAVGTRAKRALYQRLVGQCAEGLVFKHKDAPYRAGRPASGGQQRKHKLLKSCDVIVSENSGNAYTMVVLDAGAGGAVKRFVVGKVFAGTTNQTRQQLDALLADGEEPVCEVQYLYATDDDQLFQPVFVRLRDDKDGAGCTRAQLKKTDRTVLG
jgi:bifunctional non-homologous end joining protein LigD